MEKPLYPGQTIKLTTTFRNEEGHVFDPHEVKFKISDGDGGQEVYDDTTRVSEGVYSKNIVLTTGGTWWYRNIGFNSSGEEIAVDQENFEVEPETPFDS